MIRLAAFADEIGKDFELQLEVLKETGVSMIELRSVDGIGVQRLTVEQAKEYKARMDKAGVSVWSIGSPLGKVDIDTDFAEYEKLIRHICELANIFETDKIRMFSFFKAYDAPEKVFEYLRRMTDIAEEYGVCLYHENEKDIYGDTLARVLEVLDNAPKLKVIYDPANFLQVGERAEDTLNALHARTDYFHIKDVISETGELVPAGYGDGKIEELVNRITDDKTLTLEPHLAVFDGYASIDDTEMKNKFKFNSNVEAFKFAVKSMKEVLVKCGYHEENGGFVK